jgi:hypothetical protein
MSSPISNTFDFNSLVHPQANRLTAEFNQLRVRMEGIAKAVPDDREDLFQEKEEWLREWRDVTVSSSFSVILLYADSCSGRPRCTIADRTR